MPNQIIYWAAAIITLLTAATMLWKTLRPIVKRIQEVLDNLDSFTRDWAGEPASPGRDAIPGVMERLNDIDGELKHNGGSTMKDAIKRIETKLERIDSRIEKGDKRFLEGAQRFDKLESDVEELKRGLK